MKLIVDLKDDKVGKKKELWVNDKSGIERLNFIYIFYLFIDVLVNKLMNFKFLGKLFLDWRE